MRTPTLFIIRVLIVLILTAIGSSLLFSTRDFSVLLSGNKLVCTTLLGIVLLIISGKIMRCIRNSAKTTEEKIQCAPGDGGVPCTFGCDWIDKNGHGTGKVCDCKNCRDCAWDEQNKKCVPRDQMLDRLLVLDDDGQQDLSNVTVGFTKKETAAQLSKDTEVHERLRKTNDGIWYALWSTLGFV